MEGVTRFLTIFFFFMGSGPSFALNKGEKIMSNSSKSRRDIRDFRCLASVNDTGEAYYLSLIHI